MTRHSLAPDIVWREASIRLRLQERVPVGAFESAHASGVVFCLVGAMNLSIQGMADTGVNDRLDVLGPIADVILEDHPELRPEVRREMDEPGALLIPDMDEDEAFLIVTRWNDRHCDSGARAADLLEKVISRTKVPV